MKRVYFVRHGKSSWEDSFLKDHDRPLKKRGRNDAKLIAGIMKDEGLKIDAIYSSSAYRAKETALIFKSQLAIPIIQYFIDLYHAGPQNIIDFIKSNELNQDSIMLFGHNPGYTDLVNLFSEQHIYNLPTSGAFCVDFDCDSWADIDTEKANLYKLWFPKRYKI